MVDAFEEIKFGKVDIDEHSDVAEELEIRSVPSLVILEGGEELDRQAGTGSKEMLKEWIAEQTGEPDTSKFPSENLP